MADKTLSAGNAKLDDKLWGHRWGFSDTRFVTLPDGATSVTGGRYAISGTEMPGFMLIQITM